MRTNTLLILALVIISLPFCKSSKIETNGKAAIVRDCTGTYLRVDGRDYHVCNPETVSNYANGTVVTALYRKIPECNGSAKNAMVCMMLHESYGWVEVQNVSN